MNHKPQQIMDLDLDHTDKIHTRISMFLEPYSLYFRKTEIGIKQIYETL